jgi:hypothetical protein
LYNPLVSTDVANSTSSRRYPQLGSDGPASRPLSFVCVRYSDDFLHNADASPSVHDPLNQLVVVDNRGGIYFHTLGEAILAGLAQVRHDLVVIIHDDVRLPPGWQTAFETSLLALELEDPEWGVIGVAGWRSDDTATGHWSDPHGYRDLLQGRSFAEIARLDEQLLVLRKSSGLTPDPWLPSIHNIGRDLPLTARMQGRRSYVVDAPTIHKYADDRGRLIMCAADSPKIQARQTLSWRAEKERSDQYFAAKWSGPAPSAGSTLGADSDAEAAALCGPIVLLCRGGGGSRLLSVMAADAGIFIGRDLNVSGDTMEMVPAIYKGVLAKYRSRIDERAVVVRELRAAALAMLRGAGGPPGVWGFKLPESMLLIEEIAEAFPGARFVHLVRDPLTTCLRRSHMTARLDNEIGRATLPVAYRYCGREPSAIFDESPAHHMAVSTLYQIESALTFTRTLSRWRHLHIRFEWLLSQPHRVQAIFARWLRRGPAATRVMRDVQGQERGRLALEVDPDRAARPTVVYPASTENEVAAFLAPLRRRLGYVQATVSPAARAARPGRVDGRSPTESF